jgi:hypothetical protein
MRLAPLALAVALFLVSVQAQEAPVASAIGWRQNWSGSFPEAAPPATWDRSARPAIGLLKVSAAKPKVESEKTATPIVENVVTDWLALGPFSAGDPAKALDQEFIKDETQCSPDEAATVGELEWKTHSKRPVEEIARSDKLKDAPWNAPKYNGIELAKLFEGKDPKEQVGYLHTYLYSPKAGTVAALFNHGGGLKMWLNGAQVYANPKDTNIAPYNYWAMNNLITGNGHSPSVKLELKEGWNRLLLKCVQGKDRWHIDLRITAPTDAAYETKNIVWETKLPLWSRSNPIIVGDKIFTLSEPDELICLDKRSGKVLWRRTNTYFDATPETERAANPLFKEVEAVVAKMPAAQGYEEIFALRRQMRDLLYKIDQAKYRWPAPAHYLAHGFTTPTPCSDGQCVYIYMGHGVAACYDLDGNRKWIQTLKDIHHDIFNCNSPVLVGNKFIVYSNGYYRAFDKATGKVLWTSEQFSNGIDIYHGDKKSPSTNFGGSILAVHVNDEDYLIGPIKGGVGRVSDGKVLSVHQQGAHQGTPLRMGDYILDPDLWRWKLKVVSPDNLEYSEAQRVDNAANGMSSPIYHDGLVYSLSIHGAFSACENTPTGLKLLYTKKLDLKPYFEGDHCGCAISPTLAGKYVYVSDNKGTTIVVEAGREFKQVAVNRIENFIDRITPGNMQEETYAPQVCDGKYIYWRGESNLYCIGEK